MSDVTILETAIATSLAEIDGVKSCEALPETLEPKSIPGIFLDLISLERLGANLRNFKLNSRAIERIIAIGEISTIIAAKLDARVVPIRINHL